MFQDFSRSKKPLLKCTDLINFDRDFMIFIGARAIIMIISRHGLFSDS